MSRFAEALAKRAAIASPPSPATSAKVSPLTLVEKIVLSAGPNDLAGIGQLAIASRQLGYHAVVAAIELEPLSFRRAELRTWLRIALRSERYWGRLLEELPEGEAWDDRHPPLSVPRLQPGEFYFELFPASLLPAKKAEKTTERASPAKKPKSSAENPDQLGLFKITSS